MNLVHFLWMNLDISHVIENVKVEVAENKAWLRLELYFSLGFISWALFYIVHVISRK